MQSPLVAVDLGHGERKPHPGSDNFREVTLLGTAGIGHGTLYGIEKHCAYLCGDEAEECHYVALYALRVPLAQIGTPFLAIPGRHELTGYTRLTGKPTGTEVALPKRDFAPLAWYPYKDYDPAYRIAEWDADARRLVLESRNRTGPVTSSEGMACSVTRTDDLTSFSCDPFAVIAADGAPLLISNPNYNVRAAELVAAFELAGLRYYVARYGAKA